MVFAVHCISFRPTTQHAFDIGFSAARNKKARSAVLRTEPVNPAPKEIAMSINVNDKWPLRRLAAAITSVGISMTSAVFAHSADTILVAPSNLPELARQSGEAMLLGDTVDGRTLLYIEQNQGSQLAIFDVSDPAHVKSDASVTLDVPGPFDFVGSAGNQAEIVRFRLDQGEALLDLHNGKKSKLKKIDVAYPQVSTIKLSTDEITATNAATSLIRAIDPKQVRGETSNADTGTTFLLTEKGLYLIRRPALENAQPVSLNTGG
jgi:hypothetical protein